jgi:hypothetical protein
MLETGATPQASLPEAIDGHPYRFGKIVAVQAVQGQQELARYNKARRTIPMTDKPQILCADYSQEMGEKLMATASRTNIWFLIEYPGPWGNRAFEESEIPDSVKTLFTAFETSLARSRTQLIKQRSDFRGKGFAFFVIISREDNPITYEFRVNNYEDLLLLDFQAIVAGNEQYQANIRSEPLYLICTNGKRDRCCARYGMPVYEALADKVGAAAWQTTHLGGHRFAPTGVFLPHGLNYGRVTVENVGGLVDAYHAGNIMLDYYRGRSAYSPVEQAAVHFLREELDISTVNGLHLVASARVDGDISVVQLTVPQQDNLTYRVSVRNKLSVFKVYKSSIDAEPVQVEEFELVGYEAM